MSNIVPFNEKLPAAFAERMDDLSVNNDLAGDMGTGFSVLSVKGSRWRLKIGGEEQVILDEDDEPVPSIEVVLLKANPNLSHIYYAEAYEEGDNAAPDCWSVDGIAPDPQAESPQADQCAGCPRAEWGSKVKEDGTKVKECQDHRRVAVLFTSELNDDEDTHVIGPTLLRTPAASLKDLKLYGKALNSTHGLPYMAVVTRLSFDHDVAYPKLKFKAVRPVTNEEAQLIIQHMEGEIVESILTGSEVIATDTPKPKPKARVPLKEQQKQEAVDVSFEESGEEASAPAPKPKKKAAAKKAAPKVKAKAPEPEPEPEPKPEGEEEVAAVTADVASIMDDLESMDL